LPAEFEAGNRCRTVFLPSLGEVWQDPRTEEGQLLWPARFPERVIEKAKNRHLSGYAALYQQRPVPAGGGQFKEKWFRYASVENGFYVLETPEGPRRVAIKDCWRFSVIDLAISTKQSADYTVIQTYDVTPQNDLILIDQIRGHFDNPEQVKIIRATYFRLRPQFFQIESVAYQLAIIQQLRDEPVEQVDLPDLDVQVGDFLVRGSDPAALDATLRAFEQGFKAFVVKIGDEYARYANACVVRVQGDIYFFKFAMEQQGYGEIVGEIRKEDIARMEAERRRKYSIPIREYKPVRDKVSRASAPAWLMEQGKFYFLKTLPDLPLIKVEHLTFPKGAHDDMVDCSSQAAEVIFGPSGPLVWSPDDYDPIPALPVIAQPENHNLLEIDWNPPVPAAWDFSEGETVDLEIGGRWS
jgi:phage terminase large subunit-like protein